MFISVKWPCQRVSFLELQIGVCSEGVFTSKSEVPDDGELEEPEKLVLKKNTN